MSKKALLLTMALLLAVLLGATLLADVRRLTAAVRAYPLVLILPACGLVLGNYALRTIRFRAYLAALGLRLGWLEAGLTFVAGFLFTVSPGKMGEIFKGYLLQARRGARVADVATTVVAERFTDVVGLVLLGAVGVLQHDAHRGLFLTIIAACLGFLGTVAHPTALPRLIRAAQPRLRSPLLIKVAETALRMHAVLRVLVAPKRLLFGTLLAAAAWLLEAVAFRILLDGLGAGGGMGPAILVYALATLLGAASMLPGGVGSTEAVMVALLTRPALGLNLDLAQATLATLLIRFCTLWFGVLCGGGAWLLLRRLPVR